jgi:nucleotide-binding universal stress UspA family protein
MYKKILVALENSRADKALLPHVSELARHFDSELLLIHVADGWAARNFEKLELAESEEMKEDRAYLEKKASELRETGRKVSVHLAMGDPATEILRAASRERCDLIAMTAHGHRLLGDLVFGSTINEVRHRASAPILLVRSAVK